MFTAIVLVCLEGYIPAPSVCYTYTNERISSTAEECKAAIAQGISLGAFEYQDPERGEYFKPIDFYCVNWSAESV